MKAEGLASWVVSSRLKEWGGLHRRMGWGFGGQGQMGEDFDNHRGIFDGGNERDQAATVGTGCHVDRKDAFEQLSPAQAGSRRGRGGLAVRLRWGSHLVGLEIFVFG